MNVALLVARLLLAAVFVVTGIAKLADRWRSRRAIVAFDLSMVLAAPGRIDFRRRTHTGSQGLVAALGHWRSSPGSAPTWCATPNPTASAGWKILSRSGVLGGIGGFVTWEVYDAVRPSAVAWLGVLTAAQLLNLDGGVVMLAPLAGQWWLPVYLLRRTGGSMAPGSNLSDLRGEFLTPDALCARSRPVMLTFTDPGCGPATRCRRRAAGKRSTPRS